MHKYRRFPPHALLCLAMVPSSILAFSCVSPFCNRGLGASFAKSIMRSSMAMPSDLFIDAEFEKNNNSNKLTFNGNTAPSDHSSGKAVRTDLIKEDLAATRSPMDQAFHLESDQMKQSIVGVAKEFCCPLSSQLPVDPVIASDGHVYEKEAIEQYINENIEDLRSPVTDEKMEPTLSPALHVSKSIGALLASGALPSSLSLDYRKKVSDMQELKSKKELAQQGNVRALHELATRYGDVNAMRDLAGIYFKGTETVPRNLVEAFEWYSKAADCGDARALAKIADMQFMGEGTRPQKSHAVAALIEAMERGSAYAMMQAGFHSLLGDHGFPKSTRRGLYYLRKVANGECPIDDLEEYPSMLKVAKQIVQEADEEDAK